jgi:hypothetical protein
MDRLPEELGKNNAEHGTKSGCIRIVVVSDAVFVPTAIHVRFRRRR